MKASSRRNGVLTFGLIALGIVFGILSKAGDVAVQGNIFGGILYAFGSITSGFFIWVVMCTGIAILSETKRLSAVNILTFLITMLLAYYLYSHFVVNYLALSVVKFWILMLIPAAALGYITWSIKTNRILKYIVIIAGTFVMIFDIVEQGQLPIAMIMYIILYVIFLALTILKSEKNQPPAV